MATSANNVSAKSSVSGSTTSATRDLPTAQSQAVGSFDISAFCPNCATLMRRTKVFSKEVYKCPTCGRSVLV